MWRSPVRMSLPPPWDGHALTILRLHFNEQRRELSIIRSHHDRLDERYLFPPHIHSDFDRAALSRCENFLHSFRRGAARATTLHARNARGLLAFVGKSKLRPVHRLPLLVGECLANVLP